MISAVKLTLKFKPRTMKIIQIAMSCDTSPEAYPEYRESLVALCDNGSLYRCFPYSMKLVWVKLPPIPDSASRKEGLTHTEIFD